MGEEGYADDRHLGPSGLARTVAKALGGGPLSKSSFFVPEAWSYSYWPDPALNVARGLPTELTDGLSTAAAHKSAGAMAASRWCSVLRNALAHGGVSYLDTDGRTTVGKRAEILCFVSGHYDRTSNTLAGLHCLRIRERDFLAFLRLWVEWLNRSGITKLMAA